jgi:PKD repeat protein
MTTLWVFVSIYLSGKKVNIPSQQKTVQGIVTTPEETTKLVAPIDIKFDATKLPVDSSKFEITFYSWDFGDGGNSTNPVVTHTYRSIGQYNVKLTVSARNKATNESGDTSYEKLVTVSSVQVSAQFTSTPASGPAPLTVAFDASSSSSPAGQITNYEWDFSGQNNFRDANGVQVEHTFDRIGDYDVKLRVTDNNGQSNVVSQKVSVTGPDVPVPVIDIPTSDGKYYTNKQLSFLGEKTTSPNGQITKYEWDFGDGSPKATTRTANHTYNKPGLYEIILSATDDTGKSAQASQKITVQNVEVPPQAVIDTVPGPASDKDKFISGQAPFEVKFGGDQSIGTSNPIVDYKWDFDGDGQNDASGVTTDYIYKTPGSYNATLTVIDSKGSQSTAVLVVKVAAQDLQARLTADKVDGNEPLEVTFDASSSSYPDGQITSYEWDFGDGSPKRIDASQVTYKYTSIGTYNASVLAKASDGKTSKATIIINVRPVSLKACFTPSTEQGTAPLDVEFDPRCSQGAVAKYLWDFGDGSTSRTRKPVHTFDKPGSYQVTLEVTDNTNVVNTYSQSILVTGTIQ